MDHVNVIAHAPHANAQTPAQPTPILPMWLVQQRAQLQAEKTSAALQQFREAQWQAFLRAGFPKSNEEHWKYADLSFLQQAFISAEQNAHDDIKAIVHEYRSAHADALILVMVDGQFRPEFSDMDHFDQCNQTGMVSSWQTAAGFKAYTNLRNQAQNQHAFVQLNAALSSDGLVIDIPDNHQLKKPLHILTLSSQIKVFHPSHSILLGKNSELTLVEAYQSMSGHPYFINTVSHIDMKANAKLTYYKLQQEHFKAFHLGSTIIHQEEASETKCYALTSGCKFSRDELSISLRGIHASANATGFYVLNHDDQYIDHHVHIEHVAPHSRSEMFYKGIVQQQARAVFNGKLYVHPNAQKISAYQANHNLLLSNRGEVYSKPELEIYADDVRCKHGATTGQLDIDALFYLRSRGIAHERAINLLLNAFAEEIFSRIHLPDIKQCIKQMVLQHEDA